MESRECRARRGRLRRAGCGGCALASRGAGGKQGWGNRAEWLARFPVAAPGQEVRTERGTGGEHCQVLGRVDDVLRIGAVVLHVPVADVVLRDRVVRVAGAGDAHLVHTLPELLVDRVVDERLFLLALERRVEGQLPCGVVGQHVPPHAGARIVLQDGCRIAVAEERRRRTDVDHAGAIGVQQIDRGETAFGERSIWIGRDRRDVLIAQRREHDVKDVFVGRLATPFLDSGRHRDGRRGTGNGFHGRVPTVQVRNDGGLRLTSVPFLVAYRARYRHDRLILLGDSTFGLRVRREPSRGE